ncbi:suppressor of fused domain protein [Streptomyces sp. NPDC102490]|uniref:suppressor of fused domain protein n=1 Tax=Streptomyces sp. NPDC102490 TaxID=3366183 RepID=UPI00380E1FF6
MWRGTYSSGAGPIATTPVRDERFADLPDHDRLLPPRSPPRSRAQPAIGGPWLPGPRCDHLLVSLPHRHGPDLEQCPLPDGDARILRVLPVTAAEMAHRREHSHEALEQLSDEHAIVPTDPRRPSVV